MVSYPICFQLNLDEYLKHCEYSVEFFGCTDTAKQLHFQVLRPADSSLQESTTKKLSLGFICRIISHVYLHWKIY